MINHMVQFYGSSGNSSCVLKQPAIGPSGLLIVPVKDDVKMTSIGERGECRNVKIDKAV